MILCYGRRNAVLLEYELMRDFGLLTSFHLGIADHHVKGCPDAPTEEMV
jgi:hypothetical protein